MADNDHNNDEYRFTDLDSLDNDNLGFTDDASDLGKGQAYDVPETGQRKHVKRNALIAVAIVVCAGLIYKVFNHTSTPKDATITASSTSQPAASIQPMPTTSIPQQQAQPVVVQPVVTSAPVVSQNTENLLNKVNSLETTQQGVRNEVGAISQQVNTVNDNLNNLNNQINNLNLTIANLTNQLAKQSEQINILTIKKQEKVVKKVFKPYEKPVTFHIQAIIPGRAWLIGSNGSTLTVREGTKLAGYGTIKLIDSMDGRVITSSGQMIRFSQDDS